MSGLDFGVSIANILSGLVAASALVFSVMQYKRQEKKLAERNSRAQAEQVIAWAVYEAHESGVESDKVGVVIINGSAEVALEVDVKTQKSEDGGSAERELVPDGVDGQRFAMIPPGTYYLPQWSESEGAGWAAPMLVETSGGQFVVSMWNDRTETLAPVHLVPITRRPEPKRVAFLRYRIAGECWTRGPNSDLSKGEGESPWDDQFDKSEHNRLESNAVRPHKPNPGVQEFIQKLFVYFAIPNEGDPDPGASSLVKEKFKEWGIKSIERTKRRGQGLRFLLTDDPDGPQFYISGGNKGELPNAGLQYQSRRDIGGTKGIPQAPTQPVTYWDGHIDELADYIRKAMEKGGSK